MAWIIFDEADHHIPAPHFCLPSQNEDRICLRDYQEDCNLVLLISSEHPVEIFWTAIESFDVRLSEYRALDAKVLAVIHEVGERIQERSFEPMPDYPLLSDFKGKVRQSYAG